MSKENLKIVSPTGDLLHLRKPCKEDGSEVWKLVAACPPLDQNSMYMNLVQCDHFAETCVLAERDGQVLGWISGHIPPDQPDTIFVWQVAVHEDARGLGLGKRMLKAMLNRPACAEVQALETTITKSNAASWGLFRSFARDLGGVCRTRRISTATTIWMASMRQSIWSQSACHARRCASQPDARLTAGRTLH